MPSGIYKRVNPYVDLVCKVCGKEFKRLKSQLPRKDVYCGRECWRKDVAK